MVLQFDLATHTLAYVFEGPMDDATINQLRAQILEKLEEHDVINIYLEDKGIEYFTLYSVVMGIVFPLQNAKRFGRVAMVTDRNWIHLLSTLNQNFLSADMRNFITEDRIKAMDWIAHGTYEVVSKKPSAQIESIIFEDTEFAEDTLAYVIEGDMNKKAIIELRALVLQKFEEYEKINLYIEDTAISKFSLSAATIGALFPLEHAKRFNKIALVTDRKWIHVLAAIDNALIKADLKYFSRDNQELAREWIASQDDSQ